MILVIPADKIMKSMQSGSGHFCDRTGRIYEENVLKNELIKIGPVTVYGYGLMIATGVLLASFLMLSRAKKKDLDEDLAYSLIFGALIGGFAGAKCLFWIVNIRAILSEPGYLLYTLTDGFVVMGGLISGILVCLWLCHKKGQRFLPYFDLFMPSIALAQGFGRIGCFLAGCCYGKETNHSWHVVFHDSAFAPAGKALIPVQIYSSLLNFANCAVLLMLSSGKSAQKKEGFIGGLYLILYGAGRFIMEFFRGDTERGMLGALSLSQLLSCVFILTGIWLLFRAHLHSHVTVQTPTL